MIHDDAKNLPKMLPRLVVMLRQYERIPTLANMFVVCRGNNANRSIPPTDRIVDDETLVAIVPHARDVLPDRGLDSMPPLQHPNQSKLGMEAKEVPVFVPPTTTTTPTTTQRCWRCRWTRSAPSTHS